MMNREITLRLPDRLLKATFRLAQDRDASLGDVIRAAMAAEINRCNRNAKTPNRADEQLLAPLRVLLAADLAEARSWEDLLFRLRSKGYSLREAGGGLALHSHPDGIRQCKASELGYAYASLMRRFGKPFPGHRQSQLGDRILGAMPPAAVVPPDQDDIVIEPF